MTVVNHDIDAVILDALQQVFAYEMQTQVAGDPLALLVLKQADLQDDPTTTAPFLVYKASGSEDETMRLMTREEECCYGGTEIGGPIRYLYFYECTFGTPLATTRANARSVIAELQNRVIMTLIKYMDLAGVEAMGSLMSADQGKVIEGQNNRLVTKAGYRIYGGEQTFYGRGKVYWQYPVSWYIQSRFFVG